MSHTYALYKTDQCKCKILDTEYHCEAKEMEGMTILAHNQSFYRLLNSKESVKTKYNFMLGIVESLYEKCATYNLKYCPIWGFKMYDGYFSKTMKDIIILACFLVANFVVFLTMFTKTVVHLYYVAVVLAEWLVRCQPKKCAAIQDEATGTDITVYCPIRGFTKHNGYVSHAAMDFIILVCFLVANFVVFVTIFAKTLVHLYYIVFMLLQWLNRARHIIKEHDYDSEPIDDSVTRLAEAFMTMKSDEAAQWSSKDDPALMKSTKDTPRVPTKVSLWKPADDD